MIFDAMFLYLDNKLQIEILYYILINRKNERIPFAKDLNLKYNSSENCNELQINGVKRYQHK